MRRLSAGRIALMALLLVVGGGCAVAQATPQDAASQEAPATVAVERGDVEQTVTASGILVGTRKATLSMGASGRLTEVNVRPGDIVHAGDVLARLDTADLEREVTRAELAFLKQQIVYSDTVQPDPEAVMAAQTALNSAEATYRAAQQRFEQRDDEYAVSCQGYENAKISLDQAQQAFDSVANDWKARTYAIYDQRKEMLEQAQRAYDLALASCQVATSDLDDTGVRSTLAKLIEARNALDALRSPSPAKTIGAQVELERARLALEEAKRKLAAATLIAPFDGVVTEVNARRGETVGAGAVLVILMDPAAVEVEAQVIEEDVPLVADGQSASLFFDARPDAEASGRFVRIVPRRIGGDQALYPAHIAVDARSMPEGLAPGMTVDATIVIDARQDVLRLPRAVVRARSDDTAQVRVWTGGTIETRTITVGLRGDRYVEILDGLSEGERVVSE